MSAAFSIDIIGGGIGGVTLGAALHHYGLDFRILEQAPALQAVGYGLTLQRNALEALDVIGLRSSIQREGQVIRHGSMLTPDGRTLARMDVEMCAIHRATLLDVLAAAIPATAIELSERVESATTADFVIGADGFNSVVRRHIVQGEQPPRDSGYTAWRGLAERSSAVERAIVHDGVSETWGNGTRFGIVPISSDQIYWFAVAPIDPIADPNRMTTYLHDTFGTWHAPIRDLIESTPRELILESRIMDRRPIDRWHAGNVFLLGDAAHPMTPNLGQGGCQAIEDAVVLANLLRAYADSRIASSEIGPRYEGARMQRVNMIVEQSFRLGRLAAITNPVVVALRNLMLRLVPVRTQQRSLERILTFPGMPL